MNAQWQKQLMACDPPFSPSTLMADIDNNHGAFSHMTLTTLSLHRCSQPLTVHQSEQAR